MDLNEKIYQKWTNGNANEHGLSHCPSVNFDREID
jgi:hypothetical protein